MWCTIRITLDFTSLFQKMNLTPRVTKQAVGEARKELLMEKWCPVQHGRRQNISSNEIQERRLIPEMHLFFLLANGNVLWAAESQVRNCQGSHCLWGKGIFAGISICAAGIWDVWLHGISGAILLLVLPFN